MNSNAASSPRWDARFHLASALLSGSIIVLGLLVLVGWAFDNPILKSIHPSLASMKANTAILFVLLGTGLWSARREKPRLVRRITGALIITASLATLAEYLLGANFGIDELFFEDIASAHEPGRMAVTTGVNFLLLGLALLFRDGRLRSRASRAAVLLAAAISLVAVCGYLYGASSLYAITAYSSMALHTALGFIASCCAFLLARPTEGIVAVLASETGAGRLLRRMLPATMLLPIAIGWARLRGEFAGYYDLPVGLALMVLSTVVTLGLLISIIAASLYRSELRNNEAVNHLRISEERFRALVEASAQIVWTAEASGAVREDSPSWRGFTGQTYEQWREFGWLDALHPEDRERTAQSWRDAVQTETVFATDYRIRSSSGEWRWTSARAVPLRGPEGAVRGWVGMNTDITERKHAEAERELRMRELVENSPQAMAMFDTNMRYVHASPRWLQDYGLPPGITGKSHYELFPELPEHWKAVHRRCLAGATEQSDGEQFIRQDGTIQWVRWKECPWHDLGGSIAGVLIFAEDITQLKQAVERSRAAQEQLRLAQRIARIGTFEWNIQTGVNMWTPELEIMYGLPVGGFPQTQPAWENLVHPEDRAEAARRIQEAFETGAPVEGEWRAVWPDGSTHWLAGRFQVLRDNAGKPLRLVGINIEITERKQAEAQRERLLREIHELSKSLEMRVEERTRELALARDKLDGIISLAADAIVSVGEDSRITIFNRGAEEIFGWTRDEVLGKPLDILLPERFQSAHRGHIADFAREPTKARRMAERRAVFGRRKNGEDFPAEAAISKLETEAEVLFTVILRDISEQKRLEAERARAHAEREVLLKEIHHRVKNNLQVISSLFYLQSQRTEQEAVRRLLDESRGRIQSIALIHEKLYQSEHLAWIDFGSYLKDLTNSLTGIASAQAPQVKVHVQAENIFLDIDRATPCALIVNELVSNAMKHAFPGGRPGEVRIGVCPVGSNLLQLEVSDTGIGFPEALDFTATTTLGMQLVVSLTKQLRGTVELRREGGTAFRIQFPLPPSPPPG
jgi:PAS domain S-box-containing protein